MQEDDRNFDQKLDTHNFGLSGEFTFIEIWVCGTFEAEYKEDNDGHGSSLTITSKPVDICELPRKFEEYTSFYFVLRIYHPSVLQVSIHKPQIVLPLIITDIPQKHYSYFILPPPLSFCPLP